MKSNLSPESKVTYELDEAFAMERIGDSTGISILIKHDYYSSDNDYGRMLLNSMLCAITSRYPIIESIFILDTGVRIFINDHPAQKQIVELINDSQSSFISNNSLEYYGIQYSGFASSVDDQSLLLMLPDPSQLIVLE